MWILPALMLIGAGYFMWDKYARQNNITGWNFIPADAALVYETNQALEAYELWASTTLGVSFLEVGGFSSLKKGIEDLQAISNDQLVNLIDNTSLLISVHDISRHEFDFLYVLEVNSISAFQQLQTVQEHFQNQHSKKTRTYLDNTITEISNGDQTLSFLFYKNFLVASFSAFLVEDAIRTLENKEVDSFQNRYEEITSITKLTQDQGNLYINLSSSIALTENYLQDLNFDLSGFSYLDLNLYDNLIELNGFTIPNQDESSFLTPHQNISPGTFDMGGIIPLQSAMAMHYSFSDPVKWGVQQLSYLSKHDPSAVATSKILKSDADFNINQVFELMEDEIGLVYFERVSDSNKMMVLEVKDSKKSMEFFDNAAIRFSRSNSDTLYSEVFEGYELRLLQARDFPEAILGKVATGFQNSYYTNVGNFLLFADELYLLKDVLTNISGENVWAKSLEKSEFFEVTNQASNFSLFINTPDFWTRFDKNLNAFWRPYFEENASYFKSLDNIAFQFSNVDDRFFTNIVISQSEPPTSNEREIVEEQTLSFAHKLVTEPFVVRNHDDNSKEIFVQDSANNVYLIDKGFSVLWSFELPSRITSPVYQIDYYGNNKLQLLFTTENSLYIVDRNGTLLPGFPTQVKGLNTIQHLQVVDYDGSKKYRFSLSDNKGNVFLTDKNGKSLEGWSPKKLQSNLIAPVWHERIGKRDVLVSIRESGVVEVFNRRGKIQPNFPVDFGIPFNDNYHLRKAGQLKDSELSLITENGELVSVTLTGQIKRRDQLYKPSPKAKYQIIKNQDNSDFLISAWDSEKWTLLNKAGAEMFSKDYFSGEDFFQQYYSISADRQLIFITEKTLSKTYIYNLEGQLLTKGALDSSQPLNISYNPQEDTFTILNIFGYDLQKLKMSGK